MEFRCVAFQYVVLNKIYARMQPGNDGTFRSWCLLCVYVHEPYVKRIDYTQDVNSYFGIFKEYPNITTNSKFEFQTDGKKNSLAMILPFELHVAKGTGKFSIFRL